MRWRKEIAYGPRGAARAGKIAVTLRSDPRPTILPAPLITHPVLTALAYAALGWVSLQIAIPPDYVSLVFLPAGLALGLALIVGPAVLPGVLVGSLAVQWMALLQTGGTGNFTWVMLLSPLGAVAQAQAGAWLIRRWARYPGALDRSDQVLLVLLFICPTSTLLNASISVPALLASGVIPAGQGWFSWWTWWMGDALGATLMLPVMLAFGGRPLAAWQPRRMALAGPMLMSMLVVGVAFTQVRSREKDRLHERLDQHASSVANLLQRRLDAQSDSVVAVARLMQLAPQVSQEDFGLAVRPWLGRYSGTQNFGWSPLVTQAQRPRYEATNGPIMGRDASGQRSPAPAKDEYLPITLIEPLEGNRNAVRLDITHLPATAETVQDARTNSRPAASAAFRLVQETGTQRAVVLYQAVYRNNQREALKGIVSAVFRMDDVLLSLVGMPDADRISYCLLDLDAPADNRFLSGPVGCEQLNWTERRLVTRLPVYFGGHGWELRVRAEHAFVQEVRDWRAWGVVALSLTCVGLLGAYLLMITGQNHRTRHLVELRTAELAQLAHFDSLTGLPNRSHWVARAHAALQNALRHHLELSVLFLDLDHFKHVNDTLGHTVGDRLLCEAAQRLLPCLRSDDVLARIGGDEFVALLPRVRKAEDTVTVAEKLIEAMNAPIVIDRHDIQLSVSMGIACFPRDGADLDTLLKHADTAMYVAKESGRNGYRFFEPEMNARVSRRMFLEGSLRQALDLGQFFLVYQPQIATDTGRCVGLEALLRWRHPGEGLIPPDQFIPVAEDSGLIESIGTWVLREACAQLARWSTEPGLADLRIAIHISPLQFRRAGFVDMVRQALQASGLPARRVELEITESLLMQPQPDVVERLNTLAGLGIAFALDDFGTGYSSLGYLKRLPINRIKLDKSFVQDVPGNAEDEAVARATLSMTKDLGLECVAEGVETRAQQDYLIANRCAFLQGYRYARPMPADECLAWLRHFEAAEGMGDPVADAGFTAAATTPTGATPA